MSKYDTQKLIQNLQKIAVEILPSNSQDLEKEISTLISESKKLGQPIRHYIGFEISGKVHIGTGMMTALAIKNLQDAGVKCCIYLADYHTWLNQKLDGNIETIRSVALKYFAPVMLKCVEVVGGKPQEVDIILAKDIYHKSTQEGLYQLDYYLECSRNLSLSRVTKSITIMGKKEGQAVSFGALQYPPLQVADAFLMQTHIVHAGMDQRKCHVLMREVAPKLLEDFKLKIGDTSVKPIAVHHPLLLSLGLNPESVQKRMTTDSQQDFTEIKMSKSNSDTAVWVHDTLLEIERKLKKAYCPMPQKGQSLQEIENIQTYNPILNWCEKLVFPADKTLEIQRPEKFGGHIRYSNFSDLKKDYIAGKLHPLDLKKGLASCLAEWFTPIREMLEQNQEGLELLTEALQKRSQS